ncbi:MAG: phosphoglycerate dehydrogenase [Phycisphaeraceae bacterium]
MSRILITPRSLTAGGHPALARLEKAGYEVVYCTPGKQPSEDELLALLPGCVGYLAGVEPVSAKVLTAATELRVISRNGVGIDNVDLQEAAAHNIAVCKAEGANARGVAELAMALMFALARAVPSSDAAIKAGDWQRRQGIELLDRTIGIVGCGRIGRTVAQLATGIGMNVIGYDPYPSKDANITFASLDEVVARADVITLHCPPRKDGGPVLDAAMLGTVKPGVLIVNTARHALIDREALAAALEADRVGGVALDVFATEPPERDTLLSDPRVIATPHIGGFTQESVDRAVGAAVDNILEVLKTAAANNPA